MSLFGKKKEEKSEALLGVDLGTTGLKVVELSPEGGKIRLMTYGYADIPVGGDPSVLSIDEPKKIADVLHAIMKQSGMKATRAVASLPGSSVFHAIISIPTPKTSREDLRPIVEVQVAKLLPLPIEEMIVDSHVIDKELMPKDEVPKKGKAAAEAKAQAKVEAEVRSKTIRVQVTAAPKALVQKYIEVFQHAKIELVSLETEAFALMRSLVGKDNAKVMIVDIGGDRTNIVIAERGVPYLTRGIKSGGSLVTQALSSAMSLSAAESETMKKDLSLSKKMTMPPVVANAVKPLLHEMKYALELYTQQDFQDGKGVHKVIVTGGSAMLAGLDDAMTKTLNVNVYLGDPWARVATPPQARGVLDEVGSRFAVAIGLAMRVKEEKE
ncbi:MAG: pilus assembly protein PilM [Patescibacteria group bacterium]